MLFYFPGSTEVTNDRIFLLIFRFTNEYIFALNYFKLNVQQPQKAKWSFIMNHNEAD